MISRPTYAPLRIDPVGRAHLFVCDRTGAPRPAQADAVAPERWTVMEASGEPDVARLLAELDQRLQHERVGLRLYAAGGEPFLSDVTSLADEAGLGAGEVFLQCLRPAGRRVQCVHCRAVNDRVSTTLVRCRGCGAMLLVRDHYSRRLGAYMGVQVDAECPGEHPAPVALSS